MSLIDQYLNARHNMYNKKIIILSLSGIPLSGKTEHKVYDTFSCGICDKINSCNKNYYDWNHDEFRTIIVLNPHNHHILGCDMQWVLAPYKNKEK